MWSEGTCCMIYIIDLLKHVLWPRMWSVLFYVSLRRMYILLMLDEVLDPVSWWCCLVFCLLHVLITDRVWKFPSIIVNSSISIAILPVCLMYFDTVLLDACTLRIIVFSQRKHPFALCNAGVFIPAIFIILSSALSEIDIGTPFFWLMLVWFIFLHSFTFNLPLSFYFKWVSCIKLNR